MSQGAFADAAHVSRYVDGTRRRVPGLADLHHMTGLLLSEFAPTEAAILVVGAGGGVELAALADAQPSWRFTGIDPSAEMINLAREVLGPRLDRINLHRGYVDDLPGERYHGATCLLTFHFLDRDERMHILKEIASRLTPGARLVIVQHGRVDDRSSADWLLRSLRFAGSDGDAAAASAAVMSERLCLFTDAEEEALLSEAGFDDVGLFYAAFSFRGWVATASERSRGPVRAER